jgi:uncharacterized membrane protein YfcA
MPGIEVAVLVLAAFVASTMAAVTGTGGGVVLLPVLVASLGVRDAIPAYTLAQFIGNLSRVWFNRREIELRVVGWFALSALPMAIAGGLLFTCTGEEFLSRVLGAFLIATVVWRRLRPGPCRTGFQPNRFTLIGGLFAFVSAWVGSAGPFLAPFFLSYGLALGAYIGDGSELAGSGRSRHPTLEPTFPALILALRPPWGADISVHPHKHIFRKSVVSPVTVGIFRFSWRGGDDDVPDISGYPDL